ncbi:DNA protecting protein DprA [Candidatus Saccharibacteria bacterium RIFCSPHIGHO2_01_FULL_45_15]|nr:MAG: DNA protecting protein DprA [Candidatus Saccharibacteria bacterium RIFCSPHIGHO2_01_FULL_45_15]OGL28937.1 MAG: DNA protecting protein DprA [Candidatus Saccharibacteria bacterium RIFCSPHIGHO2_02_FULL_46_12]OGL31950.1 MAG: DNA protecting protein DprA [Candidatus Saccharibacteria bacterium RIFCSPHIGHO2_12_FULL_44_22]
MIKINRISPQNNNFTQIINTIALVPRKLYYLGELPTTRHPTVAIVGTRKPTRYGQEVTHRLSYDLAKRGVVIVSGMALGVDAIAHRATLEAGGTTIAVQANGLSTLYPATNRQLGEDIIKSGGAIVSEYEPDVSARDFQFLERNRIVSGLSDAVLITEAAARSGTLNTAAHALEQGREVFIVPGNITSPLSAGCNALLKQGATPVTCAEDILEVVAPQLLQTQATLALGDNPLQSKIITLLNEGVRDGDELCTLSGADARQFAAELTMMELTGLIRALGGNQWTLK